MPADGSIDLATWTRRTPYQGPIFPLDRTRLQLPYQIGMCFQRLGYNHQPAGVLVQAMDNAGAGNIYESGTMMQQTVQQGARPVSCSGVNHQTCRFIEDDNGFIFMHD